MSKTGRLIAEELRRITDAGHHEVISGVVDSVQEEEFTCTVLLSSEDGQLTEGVMLNAVSGSGKGVIVIPKPGSIVWVVEIDGPYKFGVIHCEDPAKVLIGESGVDVVINGGGLGGMLKVAEVVERLNAIENCLSELKSKFTAWMPAAGDGGALLKSTILSIPPIWTTPELTMRDDVENVKVKQ